MNSRLLSPAAQNLTPYIPTQDNPWDSDKVQHLFRRISFGISDQDIPTYLVDGPSQVIDSIVDNAASLPATEAPEWGYWARPDFDVAPLQPFAYRRDWQKQTLNDLLNNGLRESLTLFWSNHFVTEYPGYGSSPSYLFQYYNTLQTYALGNFKDFVHAIGLTSPMLMYLNGYQNKKNSPNENYARELYELFTLGENNGYTQTDIEETARALTGWNDRPVVWGPITFKESTFDDDPKTIFEQTDNWGYDDVIDILFEQKGSLIANFICKKLYTYFIGGEVDVSVISNLAQTFIDADFEIAPVVKDLLKSESFFNSLKTGVIIKSPLDLYLGLHKELNFQVSPTYDLINRIRIDALNVGQELYNPPDVAGWQGDRSWINSSSFTGRWKAAEFLVNKYKQHDDEQFRTWAINVAGNGNDPAVISKKLVDFLLTEELPNQSEYDAITDVFKGDVPQNYFDDGVWDLYWADVPNQVRDLLYYIVRIPEFQLK